MKKSVATALVVSLLAAHPAFGATGDSSSGSVISKMSPKELLEFYKKNPDYGKKRIGLDYGKYVEGDWVVLRGEYFASGSGSAWTPGVRALFEVEWKQYVAVTGKGGVFNLEVPKSEFLDGSTYAVSTSIDGLRAEASYGGKKLKEDSVYHFRLYRNPDGSVSTENVHNAFYEKGDWKVDRKVLEKPSVLGIQGMPFAVLSVFLSVLAGFSFYRRRKAVADEVIAEAGREGA